MSYILEALKKSDKERQREKIPDLQADHSLPFVERRKRKGPALYLLGALVLAATVVLGWRQFTGDPIPQLADTSKTDAAPVTASQVPEVPEPLEQTAALPAAEKEPVPAAVSPPVVSTPEIPTFRDSVPEVEAETAEPAGESAPPVSPEPVVQDTAAIPLLDELPAAVRKGIPELSFAGHVYADEPAKRLIIINNRIVREGAMVSNGLSLETIEANSVVLQYETVLFRVQLF